MREIKELGKKIRKLRRERKYTLVQLSELSGISQGYLSRIENGLNDPTFSILLQIARALQVQVSLLYPEETKKNERYTIIRKDKRILKQHSQHDYSHIEFPTQIKNRKLRAYITEPSFEPIQVSGNDERIYFILDGLFQFNDEILEAGDVVYIEANFPHIGNSVGDKKAHIFSVIYSLD